jgi:hypothetical protein
MTVPFNYPEAPHVRRHGPRGYADYESFRPWLRDEFAFRCVYCLVREGWGPIIGVYALDHFVPVSLRTDLALDYDNLLYSCVSCNLVKAGRQTPDPATVLLATQVRVTEDGTIQADNAEAGRLIDLVGLNRPRLRELRELWIGITRLAAATEPLLYRRLLGFPDDLPNLGHLRPPSGNTRPEGVAVSFFAQHKDGRLPTTY